MSQPLATYDPGQIFLNLAGISITGYADGTFVTIERMSDAFSSVAGAGGEVARIRSRDKRASVKLTLMQSSLCNDALSALAAADENNGSGVGVFSIADGRGTTLGTSTNAWIKKLAPVEEGKELTNREWEIECESLDLHVGSNI